MGCEKNRRKGTLMGTLRVISGSAKGSRLKTVPGDSTRPITDQVKESLFNILGNSIVDQVVLDLFGGTGAVGIEALSRGADFVTFLDINYQAVKTIKENLDITKFSEYSEVFKRDAFDFLKSSPDKLYDLIYVAPPQYRKMWQEAMRLLDNEPNRITENGKVIVQINPLEWEDINLNNLTFQSKRKYGDTMLIFFCRS
jgi:16S rRNA (guanine966-N2)-methyltransferase